MINWRSRAAKGWGLGIALVVMITAIGLAFVMGPWRESYLENRRSAQEHNAAPPMTDFVPATVTGQQDLAYGTGPRETLDAWYPAATPKDTALPVIVWVHGGGWIGGDKRDIAPYIKILADKGFTTVGINYSLAPDDEYPTQIRQLNSALDYLVSHAEELHIDPDRILLAGDSGGAHIAAQFAAAVTNPALAKQIDVSPTVRPDQIAGLLFACGAFDLLAMDREVGGIVSTYVQSYLGGATLSSTLERASVGPHITAGYPATWLASGNADPLTPQVKAFAKQLTSKGVDVETVLWPKDHVPRLGHEYQFNLALPDAVTTLDSLVAFALERTAEPPQG